MERPYKIAKKLASYQIQGLFKDIFQFWPNSRTFKALKMKQFLSRIFKVFQGCGSPACAGPTPVHLLIVDIWGTNQHMFMLGWYSYHIMILRCHGGVSIPCWPATPTVSPGSSSWMRSYPPSKSVCQVWFNYWNEKCQTTYGSRKVCNYELDHCNGHRTCETLTSNETVEIPVTSTCLSVVYFDSKTDRM